MMTLDSDEEDFGLDEVDIVDNNDIHANQALIQEIAMRLECCSCHNVVPASIRQCSNGHLLCKGCLQDILVSEQVECPSCSVSVKEPLSRNIVLEELAATNCIVPCRYQKCNEKVKHVDLARHIKYCKGFMPLNVTRWMKGNSEQVKVKEEPCSGSVMKDILKHLECRFCDEIAPAPILQCQKGHIVCSTCIASLGGMGRPKCPACSINMKEPARNLHLEEMVASRSCPCRYEGCNERIKHMDLEEHLKACECQPVKCLNCKEEAVFGDWELMWKHYKETHLEKSTKMPLSNLVLNKTTVSKMLDGKLTLAWWGYCVEDDGAPRRIFPGIYCCKKRNMFFVLIRELGPRSVDSYRVVVSSPGSTLRMEAFGLQTTSYRIPYVESTGKPCLAISARTFKRIVEEGDGTICCQVSLAEEC